MGRIAAFFDIDGTIYREGLITEVFKKIIKYEFVEEEKWYTEVRPAFLKWDRRQGDYDDYLLKMVEVYKEATKGLNKAYIEHIAKQVIHQKGERVYKFSRNRIKWHKRQGHLVIAISGSPNELVSEMAKKYEMDDFRGTVYELDALGRYNGRVKPMWDSESKQKAIHELCELYDIDLENSFAYGDTSGDFTMFEQVGLPYAINPTKELLTKIIESDNIRNKIQVIVERKDVMYRLDINHINIIE